MTYVLASFIISLGLAVLTSDVLAQTRPALYTLPLDEPVPFFPELTAGPFDLIERPEGVYLIRSATAEVLARLPYLDPTSLDESLPGFSLDSTSENDHLPPQVRSAPGFPLDLPSPPAGSVAVGDLTGNGESEIIVALQNGEIWVLDRAGEFIPGWPVFLDDPVQHAPQLIDIDEDGAMEVIVGTLRGFAYALDGRGKQLVGWPVCIETESTSELLWASPIAGDLFPEHAGLEVVISGTEGTVQVFGAQGQPLPGWPHRYRASSSPPNPAGSYSHPIIADLGGDGDLEIMSSHNSGILGLLNRFGQPEQGWPNRFKYHPRLGFGSPVVRDLDEGAGLEIVVASDRGFMKEAQLWVLSANGRPRRGWPVDLPEPVTGGLATGDLGGDGNEEIIVAGIGGDGQINVLDLDGSSLPGWPRTFRDMSFCLGPVVADFDGDGEMEIAVLGSVVGYGARTALYVLEASGEVWEGFPIHREGYDAFDGGLSVADVDGDGYLELMVTSAGLSKLEMYQFVGSARDDAVAWSRSEYSSAEPARVKGSEDSAFPVGPLPHVPTESAESPFAEIEVQLPSPLDRRSTLSFQLRRTERVRLEVLTVQGTQIRALVDSELPQGLYAMSWDGMSDAGALQPAGIYFFQITIAGETRRRQLLLLR